MTLSYSTSKNYNKKFKVVNQNAFILLLSTNTFCAHMSKKLFFITNKVFHKSNLLCSYFLNPMSFFFGFLFCKKKSTLNDTKLCHTQKYDKKFQSSQLECFYSITVNKQFLCMHEQETVFHYKVLHKYNLLCSYLFNTMSSFCFLSQYTKVKGLINL